MILIPTIEISRRKFKYGRSNKNNLFQVKPNTTSKTNIQDTFFSFNLVTLQTEIMFTFIIYSKILKLNCNAQRPSSRGHRYIPLVKGGLPGIIPHSSFFIIYMCLLYLFFKQ